MKLEIKIDKEIIDFCKLNELDLTNFIYDCLEKGYIQNKWGRTPMESNKPIEQTEQPVKKKTSKKKKENPVNETIEQKKSESVKQTPINNDIYGED